MDSTRASNELSSEASLCAAYYSLMSGCLKNKDGESDKTLANTIEFFSKLTAISGIAAGMSADGLKAKMKLAEDGLRKEVDGTCVNAAVLINRYAESCKHMAENPSEKLKELLSRP